MTVETTTPQTETPSFHRWRWLWVWLLLVGIGALIMVYSTITLNATAVPAMLLFGALSGPIAFATFVGDRADVEGVVPLFNLVLIILFGGAIGVLAGGALDSLLIGDPATPANIWWVGPAEETAKLILPVALYIFGRQKYRSVRAGLVIGLASAAGFAVLETMGYGLNEILKAGPLLAAETPLQGADRLELARDFVAGFKTPIVRGLLVPFTHLAWTGLIATTWWSEWEKHGRKIRITGPVIWSYLLGMFLHSANDFFPIFIMAQSKALSEGPPPPFIALSVPLSIVSIVVVTIASFTIFWRTVKKRVPMKEYGKLFHRKRDA